MFSTKGVARMIAVASLLSSCSSGGPLVEQTLDTVTGVTVTRSTAPVVLYRDNSAYAAHARDYVYLGPVEINRMGNNSYFLWLGIWSTMSDESRSAERDGFESVILYADGEPLPLEFAGWTLEAIGVSKPVYVKPVASAADAYYRVTVDQIRFIAESSDIQLRVGTAQPKSYALWDKQGAAHASIRAFVYGEY
jgi:hypothetical protein